MMESWEKDIVPQVLEQFAAYDSAGSGPACKAVAESGRRLETDMGSILANALSRYKEDYKNRAFSAARTGLSYPETLIQSTLPAAMEQRNITAQQEYEKYQDWFMSQPWANPWLQYALPLLKIQPFENIATVSGGQEGIFGDLLGAGAELGKALIKGPSKAPIVLA